MGNTWGGGYDDDDDDDDDDDLLLPEDALIQILAWLPVVCLLRFRSVCKSWRSLIDSSFFIDLHTTTTFNSSSSKFGTFFVQASFFDEIKVFMLSSSEYGSHFDDQHQLQLQLQLVFKLDNLGLPSCYTRWSEMSSIKIIVGSCNGLICLYDDEQLDISLWNPATKQFRILPKSIIIQNFDIDLVGFGFDVKTKDYKVVLIAISQSPQMDPLEHQCRVQVYCLSTDSWRLLEGINSWPGCFLYNIWSLYINGSGFFISSFLDKGPSKHNPNFAISFDFTREIITTIQFPQHDLIDVLSLSCFGDKMALFIKRQDNYVCEYFNIWVWNQEDEFWTKLHSFQMKIKVGFHRPIGIFNNGEFAFLEVLGTDGIPKYEGVKKLKL